MLGPRRNKIEHLKNGKATRWLIPIYGDIFDKIKK